MPSFSGVPPEDAARRVHDLETILRSYEVINSPLHLDAVLDSVMENAVQVTGAEASCALLVEGDRLYFTAAYGVKSEALKRTDIGRGEGIAGWVFEHNKPLLVGDVRNDPRFTGNVDRASGFITVSILAVPLTIEGEIIGVVEAVNKKGGGAFDAHDCELLTAVASAAATAVHKARLYRDLDQLFFATIQALANAIEAKDEYTRGHSERIREFSTAIAGEMGITERELRDLTIAALLHDVGKIGVPEAVLRKEGKLTDDEYARVKRHPDIGADMLGSITQLAGAIPGIRFHQERYDGKGYPSGIAGTAIPLFARIIAVADTFDAMTSDRPYRKGLPEETALGELERGAGVQFDPACVEAMARAYEKGRIVGQSRRAGNAL